jgi:hypothetical protein
MLDSGTLTTGSDGGWGYLALPGCPPVWLQRWSKSHQQPQVMVEPDTTWTTTNLNLNPVEAQDLRQHQALRPSRSPSTTYSLQQKFNSSSWRSHDSTNQLGGHLIPPRGSVSTAPTCTVPERLPHQPHQLAQSDDTDLPTHSDALLICSHDGPQNSGQEGDSESSSKFNFVYDNSWIGKFPIWS